MKNTHFFALFAVLFAAFAAGCGDRGYGALETAPDSIAEDAVEPAVANEAEERVGDSIVAPSLVEKIKEDADAFIVTGPVAVEADTAEETPPAEPASEVAAEEPEAASEDPASLSPAQAADQPVSVSALGPVTVYQPGQKYHAITQLGASTTVHTEPPQWKAATNATIDMPLTPQPHRPIRDCGLLNLRNCP
jgi:hypothetical protein